MDTKSIFGGNPLGVIIRLVLLSIVVGIVLSTLGITPANLFQRLDILARRIYDLGFGSVEWLFSHLLLGAMLVIPIWLLARVFCLIGGRGQDDRRP
jgi:hypothetical protein